MRAPEEKESRHSKFTSIFPLNTCKELVKQSLKQQNFTSLYHLLPQRLSLKWLRSNKYRLTTAVLAQLPRFQCGALCSFRQPVELSLIAIVNGMTRAWLRYSTSRSIYGGTATSTQSHSPRSLVASKRREKLCSQTMPLLPVTNGRLNHHVTGQEFLESAMCFGYCITVSLSLDLLLGLFASS
ncbi:hypothetical protein MRX96_043258 [Rhipicephalus microplus]